MIYISQFGMRKLFDSKRDSRIYLDIDDIHKVNKMYDLNYSSFSDFIESNPGKVFECSEKFLKLIYGVIKKDISLFIRKEKVRYMPQHAIDDEIRCARSIVKNKRYTYKYKPDFGLFVPRMRITMAAILLDIFELSEEVVSDTLYLNSDKEEIELYEMSSFKIINILFTQKQEVKIQTKTQIHVNERGRKVIDNWNSPLDYYTTVEEEELFNYYIRNSRDPLYSDDFNPFAFSSIGGSL